MKHITACLGLIASIALMVSSGHAQSTSGESVGLMSGEGTTLAAQVSRDAKDYISVEIDGTTYRVSVRIAEGKTMSEVSDDSGDLLLSATRDARGLLMTDGRGNSVLAKDGIVPAFTASRLFDPVILALLERENLARLRATPVTFEPGFTIGELAPQDSLCCDTGTVSNCFEPDDEGNCSAGQELVACPNDGPTCEINGTWNCC